MKKNNKPVAIIFARGNSKRISKKNIKIFNKKPIISYSIKAALKSKIFQKWTQKHSKTNQKSIKITTGAKKVTHFVLGAVLGAVLEASWRRLGRVLGANIAPSWLPKSKENP